MSAFRKSRRACPVDKHCSQWAWKYLTYCLCSGKDGVSLSLGLISVVSWSVAEIPQLITNYKDKSSEGLSLTFLVTWLIGDLFNVSGCILEPVTLSTQYYTAMLYTVTTFALTAQATYYGHIYPRLYKYNEDYKGSKPYRQIETQGNLSCDIQNVNGADAANTSGTSYEFSAPIPLPKCPHKLPRGQKLYYVSARSLSSSQTPPSGSLVLRMIPFVNPIQNPVKECLLDDSVSTQSAPELIIKTTLCLVSSVTFLLPFHLHQSTHSEINSAVLNRKKGFVIKVGRKLLLASGILLEESGMGGSSGLGTYLGWAMAAIYMGARLPQIYLNIRRGTVEGLNPLMFVFALVGNITYVASILVSSMDWSRLKPNLPWLVDAGGCVLLDGFILIQFIYFSFRTPPDPEYKPEVDKCRLDGNETKI